MRTFAGIANLAYGSTPLGLNLLSSQAENLLCAWPMSDGAGRVLQEVVSGRHGYMLEPNVGEYTWLYDPVHGPCLKFNGVNANNYVLVEDDPATAGRYSRGLPFWQQLTTGGSMTATYWAKFTTLPAHSVIRTIFSWSGSGGNETQAENQAIVLEIINMFGITNHRVQWETGAGTDTSLVSTATVTANIWIHVAVVRDNDNKTLTFYFNTVPESPQSYTDNPDGATDGAVVIGRDAQSASSAMVGMIRDLRLYRGVKTEREIRDIYDYGGDLYSPPLSVFQQGITPGSAGLFRRGLSPLGARAGARQRVGN